MELSKLKSQYKKAKAAYYNSDPIMTDAEFDKLENKIRKLDPNWAELAKTGVRGDKKTEVELDHPMPSLNKAYPKEFPKWITKNAHKRYIVMSKLDGSSVQLTYEGGRATKLVTRGDGLLGGDISFLIPHLDIPTECPESVGTVSFRCEVVLTKARFERKWARDFENSRNMVNGLLNRRQPHKALPDFDVVVLGAFNHSLKDAFALAAQVGLESVGRQEVRFADLSSDSLASILKFQKEHGAYEVDGLVVAPQDFVMAYENNDKPKNIVAFKLNDDENAAQVKVKSIIWQVTGRKRIVPKIEIEPTRMDGVTVTHAAAHNAKWMLDRGIGPGAIVKVLRSGGVIPKIVEVVKKGKVQEPDIPFKLDGVHYVVAAASVETNRRVSVLNVVKFMKTLGIELIAGKTAANLYDVGLRTPLNYIMAFHNGNLGNLINKAGFDGKQGNKIYDELRRVFLSTINMKKLMVATQLFGVGIGERKLSAIEDFGISMEDLTENADFPSNYIQKVPGFSGKTAKVLDDGFAYWVEFYHRVCNILTIDGSLPRKKKAVTGSLTGQKVSFTGFRDADLEQRIVAAGGEVVSFGGKTTVLVYKDGGKASSKVEKAQSKGTKIVEVSKFKI